MIIVDGISYDIGVQSLKRKARFENRFTGITEDGKMHAWRIGTYYDYQLILEPSYLSTDIYNQLYYTITSPIVEHTISVPNGDSMFTFVAMFSNISDELVYITPTKTYWTALEIDFVAVEPSRRI